MDFPSRIEPVIILTTPYHRYPILRVPQTTMSTALVVLLEINAPSTVTVSEVLDTCIEADAPILLGHRRIALSNVETVSS